MSTPAHDDPRRSADRPFLAGDRVWVQGTDAICTVTVVGLGYYAVQPDGDRLPFCAWEPFLELASAVERLGGLSQ